MKSQMTPPPPRFKAATNVMWAEFLEETPGFARRKGRKKGAKRQGEIYEARAHKYLEEIYGEMYVANPWIRFKEYGVEKERFCQPDGIILDVRRGQITICEMKLAHTADAWWQLRMLYLPVLMECFPVRDGWDFAMLEVVRWFDPATRFPERFTKCENPFAAPVGGIGVHIWKP